MNRRLLLIALLIAMIGVTAAFLRGLARETLVIPLLRLLWGMVDLFESLPQFLVWIIILIVTIIIVLRSVANPPTLHWRTRTEESLGGRVAAWARIVTLARRDHYSRWRLAQRLALLATEIIAERNGVDLRQARQIIETRADLPLNVRAYLQAGMKAYRPTTRGLAALISQRTTADPLALDPARAVEAIEQM